MDSNCENCVVCWEDHHFLQVVGPNKSIFHRNINNNKKKEKDGIHLHQWQVAFIYGTWVMYSRRMLEGTMTIRKYFPLKNDIADQALMRIMNIQLCNLMISTYVRKIERLKVAPRYPYYYHRLLFPTRILLLLICIDFPHENRRVNKIWNAFSH